MAWYDQKCPHCGGMMTGINTFVFCPRCPIQMEQTTTQFKRGDKVCIVRHVEDEDDPHNKYYKVGDVFWFVDYKDDNLLPSYNCRIANSLRDAMHNNYQWWANSDELKLLRGELDD